MIVNGFCKEVFRELPMEFAVEAQKLLEVSLEGSVGIGDKRMMMLSIETCTRASRARRSSRGSTSRSRPARCTRSWARTAPARARSRTCCRPRGLRGHRRRGEVRRGGPARAGARGARPRGRLPRLPVPGGDSRREQHLLPAHRAQCHPQGARRGRARRRRVPGDAEGEASVMDMPKALLNRAVNEGFSGGEKKRTRSSRWRCSSRSSPFSTRPTPASTSTPSRSSPTV
jgi:hypothetical protein